jgi:Leucine-rich repeat (LRR) protein
VFFLDLVDNYAVALFRPSMMSVVLDIIEENVPELTALDLSDNKLYVVDSLSVLVTKLPNLRVLHIGRNRVSCIQRDYCCIVFHFITCVFLLFVEAL